MTHTTVFWVEETSMENFLRAWLGHYRPGCDRDSIQITSFSGKDRLLSKLEGRLKAYSSLPESDYRHIVLVDCDEDDCVDLKNQLEKICGDAGLATRRDSKQSWQIATCVVMRELESWYFGDWSAVKKVYKRVSAHIPKKRGYRIPDEISDTWEAFERVLQNAGCFTGNLNKPMAATSIGGHYNAQASTSTSFIHVKNVVDEAIPQ